MDDSSKERNKWLILVVLALAQFMLVVDVTIVNIALPSIQRTFGMTDSGLQWIVTAYALTFGGFLLLGGRTADLFGRKATFLTGLVAFTFASLGSGLSQSGNLLIIFRAIQGLAGAFMSPAALSMVLVTFHEGSERNTALSVWSAVAAAGGALGVLMGGIFTQYLGWRWNFFVNVPVGIAVLIATSVLLGKYKSEIEHRHLDLLGAILSTGGLISLVYGLAKAPTYGWGDHRTVTFFFIAFVALAAFFINEMFVRHPLVPLKIFTIRNLSGADLLMMLMSAGMFAGIFLGTLYVQDVLGYSPIRTGVSFLIFPACVGIAAAIAPRLVRRIGFKPVLIGAPMLMAAGLFYESAIPVAGHYWTNVAPGMMLMALGMGASFVCATIAATSGVPRNESGLASGLLTTSQQVGGATGLAAVTAVVASSTSAYFKNWYVPGLPKQLLAAQATVHGFQNGFLVCGYFAIAAAVVAILLLHSPQREAAKEPPVKPPMTEAPADAA